MNLYRWVNLEYIMIGEYRQAHIQFKNLFHIHSRCISLKHFELMNNLFKINKDRQHMI